MTGLKAWWLLLTYLWVRPGMFRKIGGAWLKYFLPGFHPWNEDDRHLLGAYAKIASGAESTNATAAMIPVSVFIWASSWVDYVVVGRLQAALGRSPSGVKSSANVVPRARGIPCPSQIRH